MMTGQMMKLTKCFAALDNVNEETNDDHLGYDPSDFHENYSNENPLADTNIPTRKSSADLSGDVNAKYPTGLMYGLENVHFLFSA